MDRNPVGGVSRETCAVATFPEILSVFTLRLRSGNSERFTAWKMGRSYITTLLNWHSAG